MATNSCTSINLNTSFPRFNTANEMYTHLRHLTEQGGEFTARNFVGVIETMHPVHETLVETDLFPRAAISFYTRKNLGEKVEQSEIKAYQTEQRGGAQGDYSAGIRKKMSNVISCLKAFPHSKRAVITVPFSTEGSENADHTNAGQTKCVRELHFYLEDNELLCTGILRMQNASIFPKNIHFIATVMDVIATALDVRVGEYTHWITNLCHDRSATQC